MNNSLSEKRRRLQEELKETIQLEEKEIIKKHFPEFQKMIGKCFKIRNNYSCPEKLSDYWFLYVRITDIKEEDLYVSNSGECLSNYSGFSFQTDKYGRVNIDTKDRGYVHSLGEEIPELEFEKAWNKMIKRIHTLNQAKTL